MRANILPFAVILSAVVLLTRCGQKQPQQTGNNPVSVTVGEATASGVTYYDEYPGTLVALQQTDLRAQVTGYVTGIFFSDGSKVKQGQRLYSIDQQLYRANLKQAEASLQVQETNLLKAQKDADRYHELAENDAIAKQQVDYADAALESAHKLVEAARATVDAVRANVNFANITAPFAGTIGISQVRVGTSVVAGQTILNTISSDNPIAVDFPVDQKQVYRFTQLQQSAQHAADSTFSIAFGNDIYPYFGKISAIDRAVDPQTGTIRVRLEFPNEKGLLKAGMSTKVRVLNSETVNPVLIPYKAVTEQLGEYFVYVVGDSSKVSRRALQLGQAIGDQVIVRSGLRDGEQIVVQGVQNLRDGSLIAVARDSTAAGGNK